MSKLHISTSLALPIEAVTQTFGIVGKKRSGKSSTSVVMSEEFLKQNIAPVDAGVAALGSDYEPLPTGDAYKRVGWSRQRATA